MSKEEVPKIDQFLTHLSSPQLLFNCSPANNAATNAVQSAASRSPSSRIDSAAAASNILPTKSVKFVIHSGRHQPQKTQSPRLLHTRNQTESPQTLHTQVSSQQQQQHQLTSLHRQQQSLKLKSNNNNNSSVLDKSQKGQVGTTAAATTATVGTPQNRNRLNSSNGFEKAAAQQAEVTPELRTSLSQFLLKADAKLEEKRQQFRNNNINLADTVRASDPPISATATRQDLPLLIEPNGVASNSLSITNERNISTKKQVNPKNRNNNNKSGKNDNSDNITSTSLDFPQSNDKNKKEFLLNPAYSSQQQGTFRNIPSMNEIGGQLQSASLNQLTSSGEMQLTTIVDLSVLPTKNNNNNHHNNENGETAGAHATNATATAATAAAAAANAQSVVPIRKRIPQISNDHSMNLAIHILIYKTPEQRGPEDIDQLQRAVRLFPFFLKIEQKVLLTQNICKAMQYMYLPKGKVVFYQGDLPDRFFITLKGKVSILIPKKPQDIHAEELLQATQWQQLSKEKQKLTAHKRFLYRSLHRVFKRISNIMYFITLIKIRQQVSAGTQQDQMYESSRVSIQLHEAPQLFKNGTGTNPRIPEGNDDSMGEIEIEKDRGGDAGSSAEFDEEFQRMMNKYKNKLKMEHETFKKNQVALMKSIGEKQQAGLSRMGTNAAIDSGQLGQSSSRQIQTGAAATKSMKQIPEKNERKDKQQGNPNGRLKSSTDIGEVEKDIVTSDGAAPNKFTYKPILPPDSYVSQVNGHLKPNSTSNGVTSQIASSVFVKNGVTQPNNNNNPFTNNNFSNSELSNTNSRRLIMEESDVSLMMRQSSNERSSSPFKRREDKQLSWMKLEVARLQKSDSLGLEIDEKTYIQNRNSMLAMAAQTQTNVGRQSFFHEVGKDVQNVQIAKKLQFASNIVQKQRRKMRTAIDLFVDASNLSTFKLYQQNKQAIESKIPGLELENLENGSHFFANNVFKYNHAMSSGDGYVFGELGILNKKPRSATVVCLEDCYFATLSLKKYEQILMKQEKASLVKKRVFIMETLTHGGEVSIEKMSKISYYFHKRKYQAGEVIFREGDAVKFIYLVKKGEIELEKDVEVQVSPTELFKATVRVAKLASREYFGDCDIYFDRPRFFTAVATGATTVYFCDKHQFLKCAEETKSFLEQFGSRIQMKHNYRLSVIADSKRTRNFVKNLDSLDTRRTSTVAGTGTAAHHRIKSKKAHTATTEALLKVANAGLGSTFNSNNQHAEKNANVAVTAASNIAETGKSASGNNATQSTNGGGSGQTAASEIGSISNNKAPVMSVEQAMMTKSAFFSPRKVFISQEKIAAISEEQEKVERQEQEYQMEVVKNFSSQSPLRKTTSQSNIYSSSSNPRLNSHFRNQSQKQEHAALAAPGSSVGGGSGGGVTNRNDILNQQMKYFKQKSMKDPLSNSLTQNSLTKCVNQQNSENTQTLPSMNQDIKMINSSRTPLAATNGGGQFTGKTNSNLVPMQLQQQSLYSEKKSLREEFFSSTDRIERLRSDIRANASLMRERSKKVIQLTPHEQFMQMRMICTANNKLFQQKDRVSEKRKEVQKLISETKNVPRGFHSPQRLDSLREQLDSLRSGSRPQFFEQFISTAGNTFVPPTAKILQEFNNGNSNNKDINNHNNNFQEIYVEDQDYSIVSGRLVSPIAEIGSGMSLTLYAKNFLQQQQQQQQSKQLQLSQQLQQKYEQSPSSSPSHQLKTSQLFLKRGEQDSTTKNYENFHRINSVSSFGMATTALNVDSSKDIDSPLLGVLQFGSNASSSAGVSLPPVAVDSQDDKGSSSQQQQQSQDLGESRLFAMYRSSTRDVVVESALLEDRGAGELQSNSAMSSLTPSMTQLSSVGFKSRTLPKPGMNLHILRQSTPIRNGGGIIQANVNAAGSGGAKVNENTQSEFPNIHGNIVKSTQELSSGSNMSSHNNLSQPSILALQNGQSSSSIVGKKGEVGRQLKFDDNHVERIEPKRFDLKKHYVSTKKITIVNHMQKPMIFKSP